MRKYNNFFYYGLHLLRHGCYRFLGTYKNDRNIAKKRHQSCLLSENFVLVFGTEVVVCTIHRRKCYGQVNTMYVSFILRGKYFFSSFFLN